ncbi:STAS domain-containing protein [Streptomyces sp. NPDC056670]|uniref:STAS domain-containing protein n=1 Tax=Streptomyces sp. NPDC056670 TaxID=3345904 RepID=UPI0036CCD98C
MLKAALADFARRASDQDINAAADLVCEVIAGHAARLTARTDLGIQDTGVHTVVEALGCMSEAADLNQRSGPAGQRGGCFVHFLTYAGNLLTMLIEAPSSLMRGEAAMTASACWGDPVLEVEVMPGPDSATVEVHVRGDIDAQSADVLHETLITALTSHRGTLLIDLAQVTDCDRHGLDALLAAYLVAQRAGRRLHITAVSHRVAQFLHSSGAHTLLGAPSPFEGR